MARQHRATRRQFLWGSATAAAAAGLAAAPTAVRLYEALGRGGPAAVRALVDAEVDLAQLATPSGGP